MGALKAYAPRDNKYVEAKNKLLNNVKNFYKGRQKVIEGFKNKIFPLYYNEAYEHQMKAQREIEEQEEQEEQEEKQKEQSEESKFLKYIKNKAESISYLLFNYYFNFKQPSDLPKKLFEIKDKKKNDDFVEEIKNRWSKLKDSIEKTLRDEKDNEKIEKILEIVKESVRFSRQNQQKGQGIKILTPNQMLNRLPIALAQLQAGNNSNKLKNEIRQLLYSLYCSKKMTKQIYKV